MVMRHVFNAIFSNPHLALPQSPKAHFLHLYLLCCLFEGMSHIFLNSKIYALILYWVVFFLDLLFCIISSSFIHFHENPFVIYSLIVWVIFHCVYKWWLSYPFICHGDLGCFHVLVIANSATWTLGSMSLSVLVSQVCMPSRGTGLGHKGSSIVPFLRNLHTVLKVAVLVFE